MTTDVRNVTNDTIKVLRKSMRKSINIENAVKKYGENIIIPDLNLFVKEGEFFTLLGPPVVEKQLC